MPFEKIGKYWLSPNEFLIFVDLIALVLMLAIKKSRAALVEGQPGVYSIAYLHHCLNTNGTKTAGFTEISTPAGAESTVPSLATKEKLSGPL